MSGADRRRKRAIRARMRVTGEPYALARRRLEEERRVRAADGESPPTEPTEEVP